MEMRFRDENQGSMLAEDGLQRRKLGFALVDDENGLFKVK